MVTTSTPVARNAVNDSGVVRKWNSFGASLPRLVIAVSRLTIATSAPAR